MGTFSYDRYVSPYSRDISELMMRQGEIPAQAAQQVGQVQANAALQRGNAWAGAAQNVGQAVSGAIQQATDPRRKLETQQLEIGAGQIVAQKRAVALSGQVNQLMQSAMTQAEDGTITFDRAKLRQGFAASNVPIPLQEQTFKSLDEVDKSLQAFNQVKVDHLADLAHATLTNPHGASPESFAFTAALAKANGLVNDQQLTPIIEAIANGGDVETLLTQVRGLSEKYKDVAKPIVLPRGGTLATPTGKVIAKGQEPAKTEAEVALDAAGGDAAAAMRLLKPGPKQSIEDEWMARDRRLAVAKNGGQPLSDAQLKVVDTASMQEYAQSKADPAMREAALAQKNIATLLAQAQLNQQPTKEQAASVADDLVNHRIAPEQLASLFSTRGKEGLAFKLAVAAEAKKLEPSFNFEEASASYNLVKSPGFQNTVRYMDSVLESMPRLLENAKRLGNGDWRSWNQLANAAKGQFNDTDLKRLKTDAVLVGDEVAKILSGGGTGSTTSDAKLKQGMDSISQSDSVPAMAAALDEIQTLIGYRRKAQTRGTYMEGTSAVKPKVLKLLNGRLVPE